jgi:DNA (cytosine-5)-methyltransferase 1
MVYYNEIDPYAAQWLRNLIAAGHIAPGDVDERSITDVRPADLAGYTQCHFFAGIGVWSHALRLAGWPDSRPVWTGSCPCQPFSAAGRGKGTADERHLWPVWFNLIRERRPDTVFGEQVEAAVRHGWLDLVQSDMEGEGYAFAPVGIPAAGVGAPHIRQRLWFVADALNARPQGRLSGRENTRRQDQHGHSGRSGAVGGVADAEHDGRDRPRGFTAEQDSDQQNERIPDRNRNADAEPAPRPPNTFWSTADWLLCRDGKWRPVESGTFPLAHGAAARVGRLRAYGNAIVAQVAQVFIEAYLES